MASGTGAAASTTFWASGGAACSGGGAAGGGGGAAGTGGGAALATEGLIGGCGCWSVVAARWVTAESSSGVRPRPSAADNETTKTTTAAAATDVRAQIL